MDKDMLDLARRIMDAAYAPYSNFPVGAVVKGGNGKLYAGCNVENAAYPEGCCAETSAIAAMIADGERRIVEVVVIGSGSTPVAPCGGCRQRLREFAGETTPIHMCSGDGSRQTLTLGELLPASFGPDHLARRGRVGP